MTRRQIDLPDEHAEVFIAHLNQDLANDVAQELLKLLTDRGLSCLLDKRDLSAGVSCIRPILSSIRQALPATAQRAAVPPAGDGRLISAALPAR